MSGWTGSQQQSNNIQCESKSRAFSQEEGRSKVRLDFPTALTVPGLTVQDETLPTSTDMLGVGGRGGDGLGAGRKLGAASWKDLKRVQRFLPLHGH